MKPLEIKARLLCEGVNPDDEGSTISYLEKQNPQKVLRGGLSSGLKIRLSGDGEKPYPRSFFVNAPLYTETSVPLEVRVDENGLCILEDNEVIATGDVLNAPDWYNESVDGYPITSIITQHNTQLAASVYEWCSLFKTGEQCRFCVIDKSQKYPELRSVTKKANLIMKAMELVTMDDIAGIALNGGMTFDSGRGLELMIPLIRTIRDRFSDLEIAVEMTPPEDPAYINSFAEAGGDSLMMNLEMWDEETRKKVIPGKAKYCPREQYLRAFEEGVKILGKGKVSTCFVVGTEPIYSLKEGISTVIDYNVIPSPLAGRTFEQIPDYSFTSKADWVEFLEVFRFTRNKLLMAGLRSTDKAGCVACGMCDMVTDVDDL